MQRATYFIDDANAGRRLETLICRLLPHVPRNRLLKWLRTGTVRLNSKRSVPMARLKTGDAITYPEAVAPDRYAPADGQDATVRASLMAAPVRPRLPALDVVYEDDDLLIANKPPLLASHPGVGHGKDSLSERLLAHLGAWDAPVGHRPGFGHRLDSGTSGLVPCGKHAKALKALMGPPFGPPVVKTYVALVDGHLLRDEGEISLPLHVLDVPMGNMPKVVVDERVGKSAVTQFRVLERLCGATLIKLHLHTGRTHQIRAHMRALGHPLLGDARYGDAENNAKFLQTWGIRRPCLHADWLGVAQPTTGHKLKFSALWPKDMQRLFFALGGTCKAEATSLGAEWG